VTSRQAEAAEAEKVWQAENRENISHKGTSQKKSAGLGLAGRDQRRTQEQARQRSRQSSRTQAAVYRQGVVVEGPLKDRQKGRAGCSLRRAELQVCAAAEKPRARQDVRRPQRRVRACAVREARCAPCRARVVRVAGRENVVGKCMLVEAYIRECEMYQRKRVEEKRQ